MKYLLKSLLLILLYSITLAASPQISFHRVDPPGWWTGMSDPSLQLMVYGNDIAQADVIINYSGVHLKNVARVDNPNYLVIDLEITENAQPGMMRIIFEYQREILFEIEYELKARQQGSKDRKGFDRNDVIYLLMPDRFSNGDETNDNIEGMLEKTDRSNPDGRHGGDIKGVMEKLDYLTELGVTALWLNPVQENNMPAYSYHGYAITDFYRVDPRLGDNELYRAMVGQCHDRGIKVIMDMVFNHCGGNHFWIKDLPMKDWVHEFPEFTRSNFRAETVMDPYASDFDRERMLTGWFDKPMPDLNQHNELLANYLIQNSIWWIEYAGLDGIRMDTYPYSYKDFMAVWIQRIFREYPDFSIVGETWLQKETHTAYWQAGSALSGNYSSYLPSVTDFPLQYAIKDAFNEEEGWTTGLARIYYVLAQDFIYPDPFRNVIFTDNHDLTRLYTDLGEDFDKYKMAMAVLLTTRGIPMIYYGTELLMTGEEQKGHGYIREDFPLGKWQPAVEYRQDEAMNYLRTLLNWRKNSAAIQYGKLKQFIPQDGIYVYFRYDNNDAVMVAINKNDEDRQVNLERFNEVLKDFAGGRNVISSQVLRFDDSLFISSKTALILDLIK